MQKSVTPQLVSMMYPEQSHFMLYSFLNDKNVNNNDDNKSQYLRTNTAIHFNVWRILPCVILRGTWKYVK